MGLLSTVQRQTLAAFKAIGDLARPATYRQVTGAPVRDIDAGTSVTPTTDFPLPRVVFVRYKQDEIDHDVVMQQDQKVLFPRLDLSVVPQPADKIIDSANVSWEIKRIITDPANALAILQVRKS